MSSKVMFLMANYGHDPTETAIPWQIIHNAGFTTIFATEDGKQPACDSRMLAGLTATLLGASKAAKNAYTQLLSTHSFQNPLSWSDSSFTLKEYDAVILPGGHDKAMQQIIDSDRVHALLADFFPLTKKTLSERKYIGAICHGVQVLALSNFPIDSSSHRGEGKSRSILADVKTTALQNFHESCIYQGTRLFLGDYYKTYGHGTPSVQEIVTNRLDSPEQFVSSWGVAPLVVEDDKYNYVSARYTPDAEAFGKKVVELMLREDWDSSQVKA